MKDSLMDVDLPVIEGVGDQGQENRTINMIVLKCA
jgi:hypothetical protein